MSETIEAEPAPKRKGGSFFRELPFLVLVAFVLALLIKAFLVQAFYIPSGSMENTLQIDDRVLVNKLVYDFREVHRGEVVVFRGPQGWSSEVPPLPPANGLEKVRRAISGLIVGVPGEKDFIKRVIGVGGDRVACCTPEGKVTVTPKGETTPVPLEESYLFEDNQMPFCEAGVTLQACPPGAPGVLVPEDRLWVLGDHRSASADSRFHVDEEEGGTVPVENVIGRAFVVVWPVGRASVLSVPGTFDDQALGASLMVAAEQGVPLAAGVGLALPVVALRRRLRRSRR